MSYQPAVPHCLASNMTSNMTSNMELDARYDCCKQEQRQEGLHAYLVLDFVPKIGNLAVGIRNKEDIMRTSLDALLATYAGIGISEHDMLVPQYFYLADSLLWTLLHTLPASHTMAWIHRYIISQ